MNYRERLLAYLRDDRDDINYRIDLFASGRAQMRQLEEGEFVDITQTVLVRLHRRLGEVGALIHDTAKAPEE